MAKHFITNKNPDKEVMHIGDTKDNSVENLKYGYRSELLHLTYKKHRRKGNPSKYRFSYNDEQYTQISHLAKRHNISVKLLHKRLRNGWTLQEAVEIPIERKEKILNVALYNYNGKLVSVKDIAKMLNTSTKTIYKRFKRGWSVEEVIEIPIMKRGVGNEKTI